MSDTAPTPTPTPTPTNSSATEETLEEITGLSTGPETATIGSEYETDSGSGSEYETDSCSASETETETDSASETETEAVDQYSTNGIHEDVECMLSGSSQDIIELISSDPEHYLGIVQNYTHMRDGREIYLPDLFNVLINRTQGRLTIKFKMSDNTQWYEIGFTGGDYDDQVVYEAFTEKVKGLIKNPPMSRRAFLEDLSKPEPKRATMPVSQGNQYKLSKIDRFFGRTKPLNDSDSEAEEQRAAPPPKVEEPKVDVPKVEEIAEPKSSPNELCDALEQDGANGGLMSAAEPKSNDSLLDSVVQSFTNQLRARLQNLDLNSTSSNSSGFPSVESCPAAAQYAYSKLLKVVNSTSPFVQELVETLPTGSTGQRYLVTEFLHTLSPSWTDSQLADLLELSKEDRHLLSEYDIKLIKLLDA
jgi:hypothetical protein